MNETTKILPFRQLSAVDDPLTEILRNGASRLGQKAAMAFLAQH
jgi:putative transposase